MQVRDTRREINLLILQAEDSANGALSELGRAVDCPWQPAPAHLEDIACQFDAASTSLRAAVALMQHDPHVIRVAWWRRLLVRSK